MKKRTDNYKNRFTILIYSLLVCFLTGCESGIFCPESINLGEVKVIKPNFIPNPKPTNLIYGNGKGKEIKFIDSLSVKEDNLEGWLTIKTTCKKKLSAQHVYYTTRRRRIFYKSDYDKLIIYGEYSVLQPEIVEADTVLCDMLLISIGGNSGYGYLNIVTSDRGNLPKFSTTFKRSYETIRINKDTTINGQKYQNIYYDTSKPNIYYAEGIGIVAFKYKNEWWYLK